MTASDRFQAFLLNSRLFPWNWRWVGRWARGKS